MRKEHRRISVVLGRPCPLSAGVYVRTDDTSAPPEMSGVKKIYWIWDGIASFINGL